MYTFISKDVNLSSKLVSLSSSSLFLCILSLSLSLSFHNHLHLFPISAVNKMLLLFDKLYGVRGRWKVIFLFKALHLESEKKERWKWGRWGWRKKKWKGRKKEKKNSNISQKFSQDFLSFFVFFSLKEKKETFFSR